MKIVYQYTLISPSSLKQGTMEYMFFLVNTKIHKHIRLGDGRDRCMSFLVRTGRDMFVIFE